MDKTKLYRTKKEAIPVQIQPLISPSNSAPEGGKVHRFLSGVPTVKDTVSQPLPWKISLQDAAHLQGALSCTLWMLTIF